MKNQYKTFPNPTSYQVRPSKHYQAYALVVDGQEIAWGDEKTMNIRRKEEAKRKSKARKQARERKERERQTTTEGA